MATILGIDAAWTAKNPSGVALVSRNGNRWILLRASSSYSDFLNLKTDDRFILHIADAKALLEISRELAGEPIDIVSIDMPLSRTTIKRRRTSDDLVSRLYSARKCSTHTPSEIRPGKISDSLRQSFERSGYSLLTSKIKTPGLIECYPHPALLYLTGAGERLPYKYGKIGRYWRAEKPASRRQKLRAVWREILSALESEIDGVTEALTLPTENDPGRAYKSFEDALDSVVCAWVGICVLENRAVPYGDAESAIWIPVEPTVPAPSPP